MRKIVCKEITGWDCDFVAEGDLNTQVLSKFQSHLPSTHDADLGADADEKKKKTEELMAKAKRKLPFI